MSDAGAIRPASLHASPGDPGICLGRTCLAWQADGELSHADGRLILERLCLVDALACQALSDRT